MIIPMTPIALPSIAHLPCAAWWRAARAFVAHRRSASPRKLQKLRPERKRRRKLHPAIIAQYLSGDSCYTLADRHGIDFHSIGRIVRGGLTDSQRRERATRIEREKRHAEEGRKFAAPEFEADQVIPERAFPKRTGAMIWRSIVRQSRRFVQAGCELESARMLATEIVEKFGEVAMPE